MILLHMCSLRPDGCFCTDPDVVLNHFVTPTLATAVTCVCIQGVGGVVAPPIISNLSMLHEPDVLMLGLQSIAGYAQNRMSFSTIVLLVLHDLPLQL